MLENLPEQVETRSRLYGAAYYLFELDLGFNKLSDGDCHVLCKLSLAADTDFANTAARRCHHNIGARSEDSSQSIGVLGVIILTSPSAH
jgi:hypothetical protein